MGLLKNKTFGKVRLSIRIVLFFAILCFIAIEKDFDGFIYNKLGINEPDYVEAEVLPYYNRFREFEAALGKHASHRNLFIVISDGFEKDDDTAAYCHQAGHFSRYIVINAKYWKAASDIEREVMEFHELLHCIYEQEHRYGSIMEPHILFDKRYLANYDYYIKEMFTPFLDILNSGPIKFTYKPYPEQSSSNNKRGYFK